MIDIVDSRDLVDGLKAWSAQSNLEYLNGKYTAIECFFLARSVKKNPVQSYPYQTYMYFSLIGHGVSQIAVAFSEIENRVGAGFAPGLIL